MTTGNREDYLINILRLTKHKPTAKTTELAAFMDVSAASVSEMLNILSKEGLVSYEKYKGVSLTDEGLECAKHIRRKHRIMEHFLINILEADETTAHEEACRMEHVLSDDTARKMCRITGYNDICDEFGDRCIGGRTVTLSSMEPMTEGVISHLGSADPPLLRKLIALGLIPGKTVRKGHDPADGISSVHVGDSGITVSKDLTDIVFIDPE